MLVSIGIPTYNRPIELERALSSALGQTHSDIEVLISNNCSTDPGMKEVIERYAKEDSRIRFYHQPVPIRPIWNFSYVLDMAKGEYFMWLADDDWIDNNYVEECVGFLEKNSSYSMACAECIYHDQNGEIVGKDSLATIDDENGTRRMFRFFKTVQLNAYFYSIKKTSLTRSVPIKDMMGFDWSFIAAFIFKDKVKVMNTTKIHITNGGTSSNVDSIANSAKKRFFFTEHIIGLISAFNAAKGIFDGNVYHIPLHKKIVISIQVFFIVYRRTFMWDVYFLKHKILRKLGYATKTKQ